ncbi:DciA family protein [Castellaniella sp.]|uniref:DciA family protein n=1 Tax=Castellaniella sp. TaxID=1955812 RepID=UPI002AFE4E8F|nr:DciA family protein [Castellaniella sp.]
MSSASRHRSYSAGVSALDWLDHHPQGAQLMQAAHQLMAAQAVLAAGLPPALRAWARVARIDGQQMTVVVPGPAHAARLRQLTGQAARHLQNAGWAIDSIVVRIDAAMGRDVTQKPQRDAQPLNAQALQAFEALGQQLSPSPLADAVSRLLRHHRG